MEVGVAGLSLALTALGCLSVASCRSHPERSWSPVPVVVFGFLDEVRGVLETACGGTGCGLVVPADRPELLVVEAPSLLAANALGSALLEAAGT